MTRLKALMCATALAGGMACAAAPPATAQDLQIGLEELAITGLAIAGGLLIYQAVEDADDDQYQYNGRYDDRYDFYRDNGYWPRPPRCGDGFAPPGLRKHGCRPPGHAHGHYKRRNWN
ncbi:MAG: hypothetical protein GY791_21095 [Alphaproteobacteria bacterium]|nr:hypothetical protein [Alphaproteobacteria bacterium]